MAEQIILPAGIKNGFTVDYVCTVCLEHIEQTFFWLSFSYITKDVDIVPQICPICKTHLLYNLTNITRPFKSSAFIENRPYY